MPAGFFVPQTTAAHGELSCFDLSQLAHSDCCASVVFFTNFPGEQYSQVSSTVAAPAGHDTVHAAAAASETFPLGHEMQFEKSLAADEYGAAETAGLYLPAGQLAHVLAEAA